MEAKPMGVPKTWRWRELMAKAVDDATRRLGVVQSELSSRLGVGREIMLWSRNPDPLPGKDYPRGGIGLDKAVELCRLAGWNGEQVVEMAAAWVEEGYWRVQREHLATIRMLSAAKQAERWRVLGEIAISSGKLP